MRRYLALFFTLISLFSLMAPVAYATDVVAIAETEAETEKIKVTLPELPEFTFDEHYPKDYSIYKAVINKTNSRYTTVTPADYYDVTFSSSGSTTPTTPTVNPGLTEEDTGFFSGLFNNLQNFFSNIFTGLYEWLASWFESIVNNISTAISAVHNAITTVSDTLQTFFSGIFESLKTFFSEIFDGLKSFFSDIFEKIKEFFAGFFEAWQIGFDKIIDFFTKNEKAEEERVGLLTQLLDSLKRLVDAIDEATKKSRLTIDNVISWMGNIINDDAIDVWQAFFEFPIVSDFLLAILAAAIFGALLKLLISV